MDEVDSSFGGNQAIVQRSLHPLPGPPDGPRQKPRLIEIIQNLRERIRETRANGWLGEVEGLQVSFDAAMAKLNSLKNTPVDGRPQLVDLGMPVITDPAPMPGTGDPGRHPDPADR
ncbi:hypothetical protein [Streptomyces sp. AC558_RSS880]|uniref:hypothetical protein n=1 Tax=Streptomyces sp. AC558_RSS880 TaxID=2823687 RepID=UPI001C2338DD|nr:hypothetical protein [Streptomyces sp. AC558_RSS880]